jgi:serine/threonine-protein kinase
MEYVEGYDLNELLRRCARTRVALPFELAVHVLREALRGLDYAHRRTNDDGTSLGIVHRDVSPSNLLLSFHGEVKLCDFGIARANEMLGAAAAGAGAGTGVGEALKGKAGYMSPEHARGEPLDGRADVFAAGVVLWELAAGRRMHKQGEEGVDVLERARRGDVPELPGTALPEEDKLRAILARALSADREARYPSAAAMLRDLEDYAAGARLLASPLQLGDWLEKSFGDEILVRRRARERAVAALERGPLVEIAPLPAPLSSRVVVAAADAGPTSSGEVSSQPARAALAERSGGSGRWLAAAVALLIVIGAALLRKLAR